MLKEINIGGWGKKKNTEKLPEFKGEYIQIPEVWRVSYERDQKKKLLTKIINVI